jgi:hypothetical protein
MHCAARRPLQADTEFATRRGATGVNDLFLDTGAESLRRRFVLQLFGLDID